MSIENRFALLRRTWVAVFMIVLMGAGCGTPEGDRLFCDSDSCPYGCGAEGECLPQPDACEALDCPFGCEAGACLSDPCATIECPFGCVGGACLSDPNQCGNGALEDAEECDAGVGCGIDCRCAYGYESVGDGGCRSVGSAILTDDTAESVALQSVNDLFYTEDVQGLESLDVSVNEGLRGAMRGAMRGKIQKGALGQAATETVGADLPECASLGTDKNACCRESNPCGMGTNNFCECNGEFDWDASDCEVMLNCCKEGDPCGWGNDGYCDCNGSLDWNQADCMNIPENCCKAEDPCGWAENESCDCNGEEEWDAVDCEGITIVEDISVIEFEGDCEVDGTVFSGTFAYSRFMVQNDKEGSLLDEEVVIYGDHYIQDGQPYEGISRYRTQSTQTQLCNGLTTYVEYDGMRTPQSGYIDGNFTKFHGQCVFEDAIQDKITFDFNDFIYDDDIVNLFYERYAFDGYMDVKMRLSGTQQGVPAAGYYNYSETPNADGTKNIEGEGKSFSHEAGGEVELDFNYIQDFDLCAAIPLEGWMTMVVGDESRKADFACDDLSVE